MSFMYTHGYKYRQAMKRGETSSDELRSTQNKWGCEYMALREITEWMIKKDSEVATKAMWGGNRRESSGVETREIANLTRLVPNTWVAFHMHLYPFPLPLPLCTGKKG